MNILIFGGTGFIGTNLVNKLVEHEGINLTLAVRNVEKAKLIFEKEKIKLKFIEFDFTKDENYIPLLTNCDMVIQLVSSSIPATSMKNICESYEKDVVNNLKLIDACAKYGVKRIIFSSSGGTVYGNQLKVPINERASTNPLNNYGISKLTIEKILLMYNSLYGMENIVLRIANPYGVGQEGKSIGAVTNFINKICNDEVIEIYGNGSIIRDYIYIDDLIEVIIKSIYYKYESKECIFNVGTGCGHTLNDIIKIIENKVNKKSIVKYIPARSLDCKINILDNKKAEQYLKFKPKYNLYQGVSLYINKIKERELNLG